MHSNDYATAQSLMVSVAVSSLVSFHSGVRHETQATKGNYVYVYVELIKVSVDNYFILFVRTEML